MSKQLIFVVECDKNSKSDEVYLNELIDYYYPHIRISDVRIRFVYMGGNGNYEKKFVLAQIKQFRGYGICLGMENHVLYVVDTDNLAFDSEQKQHFERIGRYCATNKYQLIWFNQSVEHVLTGTIRPEDKLKQAEMFRKNGTIKLIISSLLEKVNPTVKGSNVLTILKTIL